MAGKDTVSKHLLKRIVVDLARYLLHLDIEALELIETEQQRVEDRRADLVVRACHRGEELLFHVEIQNSNDARMPVRMLRYLTDLLMARPGLPVRQCLIYIGKAPLSMAAGLSQVGLEYRYDLIDMHQIDCGMLLGRDEPDALVLAILCDFRGRDAAAVVREILLGLRRLTGDAPNRFREYLTMLEVLSTNRDLQDCIAEQEKMLEIEIEKLPSYGIGLERGMMEGAAEGAHANAESLLRRLIASRFGVVDGATREKIAGASTDQLNDWAERVLNADSVDEVFSKQGAG